MSSLKRYVDLTVAQLSKAFKQLKKLVIKDYEIVFGRTYKLWVINVESNANLYLWENWQKIYPEIGGLLEWTNSQAYIRTYQTFEFENKWLGFGRMKWNEENNKKWTSKYRTPEYQDKKVEFYGTEVWAPDWNYCYKKEQTPELFLKVYCQSFDDMLNEGLLICLPTRILKKNEEQVKSKIESILQLIPNCTLSSIERYWTPSRGFANNIEDINSQELQRIINSECR